MRAQEEELNFKRQELEGLKQEEQQLEQQQNKSRDQLNELTKNLQDTQLQICQAKAKITHLQEQQRQMSDAIALYDSALAAGDATLVPDTSLQFNPEIENLEYVFNTHFLIIFITVLFHYSYVKFTIDMKKQLKKIRTRKTFHSLMQMERHWTGLNKILLQKHLIMHQHQIHLEVHFHLQVLL